MPKIIFLPKRDEIDVEPDAKILAAAVRHKIDIRYGCGACRCGTCAIKVDVSEARLLPMADNERELLESMKLPLDGQIRLACQTRVQEGKLFVDLDFQNKYSPDSGLDDE